MDQTPAAAPTPAPAPRAKSAAAENPGGVKDTVESILIAFILAFVFRAFVVEAFVIPTGSMAPTLLGAHMRFRCADCGYEFTVNYQGPRTDDDEVNIPRFAESLEYVRERNGQLARDADGQPLLRRRPKTFAIYCPNCGFRLGDEERLNPDRDPDAPRVVTSSPVHYGDRILVLKYQYLLQAPQRWDVVVFKSPNDPKYAQNYIKRLVGLPGETVTILDGDVYSSADGQDLSSFNIQPKPRYVQEALWRIVYDNDFVSRGTQRTASGPWRQPWTRLAGGSGWDLGNGSGRAPARIFHFDNVNGAGAIFFNPSANPTQHSLTDWLAYDVTKDQENSANTFKADLPPPDNHVSDLKLSFFYQRSDGDGPLQLKMSKIDHTFIAEIGRDSVRLLKQVGSSAPEQVGRTVSIALGSSPRHIEFTNTDYRVTLRIDGRNLIVTTPQDYHPDLPMLMDAYEHRRAMPQPSIQIAAGQQRCEISHLSLWRDIYYINQVQGLVWGLPDKLIHLSADKGREEYFVLGDNSVISGDARYWNRPINLPEEDLIVQSGRVPSRFMLGKAFFVYWPAGFRPFASAPGVIPDFGDLRFIH